MCLISNDILKMQSLIVTGKLPSTKDECATLAALNLRIYELNYIRLMEEEEERRQMKLNALAAKKSKDTTGSFRCGGGTPSGRGGGGGAGGTGEDGETATRVDVSHDDLSNNNNNTNLNRSSHAIQEEDETAVPAAAKDDNSTAATEHAPLATTTTTTKTTTIEVFKKRASSAKAVSKDGASTVNLTQPRDSLVSTQSGNLIMPVIVSNGCESMLIYLRSCSCLSSYGSARIISLGQLVSPNYQRSNDIIKLIKVRLEFLINFN